MTDNHYSVYSNYASAYESWNDAEEKECPSCHGTGLDREEIYECETCFGEGYVVPLDAALDPVLD